MIWTKALNLMTYQQLIQWIQTDFDQNFEPNVKIATTIPGKTNLDQMGKPETNVKLL